MNGDQQAVYDFLAELHRDHRVSGASFANVEKRFGRQGVVDLAGLAGYYAFLAMQLNLARYPIPAGAQPLPPLP